MKLYELATEDGTLYGQFGLRTRMALHHLGVAFDPHPVRLTEIATLDISTRKTVPILDTGSQVIEDSWDIALYLDAMGGPDSRLFGGPAGRALSQMFNLWMDRTVVPAIVPLSMIDAAERLGGADAAHLRKGIEGAFRRSLEELADKREERIKPVMQTLAPVRIPLKSRPFVSGDAPLYPDYCLYSIFKWIETLDLFDPVAGDDVMASWRQRMTEVTDGAF